MPSHVHDAGVRIFQSGRDEKKKQSLAEGRRLARGTRRRRDRYIRRRDQLRQWLTTWGLMPLDPTERQTMARLDPYRLRYEGLDRPLLPYELGRVLFALNQRRGFKSGRKTVADEDKSAIKEAQALEDAISQATCRSLGEYLWQHHQTQNKEEIEAGIVRVQNVRARPGSTGLYPLREMYEDEFDALRSAQEKHQALTAAQWDRLRDIIFHQRPLKPQELGACQLYYNEGFSRAYAAIPSAQKFRAWQEINNLKIIMPNWEKVALTEEQRNTLYTQLNEKNTLSFKGRSGIKKLLGLSEDTKFNLEDARKDKMLGVATSVTMRKPEYFGEKWDHFSDAEQDAIIDYLLPEVASVQQGGELRKKDNAPEKIKSRALQEWGLSEAQAEALAQFKIDTLESGTSRFGIQALQDLLPYMAQGLRYDEACKELGKHHSDRRPVAVSDGLLPYYGYVIPEAIANSGRKRSDPHEKVCGIIGNPTVHIGLNQLRHVVNALIQTYGHPAEIALEIARDLKMNKKQKDALKKRQAKEDEDNKDFARDLADSHALYGVSVPNTYDNRLKYKLWKELEMANGMALCPFSGDKIPRHRLFDHDVQIEYILPRSKTMDDSPGNKTLSTLSANQYKGGRSPYEAFGQSKDGYAYDAILQRVANLLRKKWRFEPDAMTRFEDEAGFLDSQLQDTQYLSRIAQKYLANICEKVRVSPGRLTAKVRHQWGLGTLLDEINGGVTEPKVADAMAEDSATTDTETTEVPDPGQVQKSKKRDDHRHHAIDALVVGLIDQSVIQRAAKASAQDRYAKEIFEPPIPKEVLRQQAKRVIERIIVAHRPDHGMGGALHEGTNYGPFDASKIATTWEQARLDDGYNVVYRKPLIALTAEEVWVIRDTKIRTDLLGLLDGLSGKGVKNAAQKKSIGAAIGTILAQYAETQGIKNVRILKKENTAVPIYHPKVSLQHVKLVAPGDIHHVQFWELPDGKVRGVGVSVFEANQPKDKKPPTRPHPAARLLMKLHKGDVISLTHKGQDMIAIVKSLRPSNKAIGFWAQTSTKEEKMNTFSFGDILNKNVKKVSLNPIGKSTFSATKKVLIDA